MAEDPTIRSSNEAPEHGGPFGEAFWRRLDAFTIECEVVIDRPKGSRHPRHTHVVYPLDYGYLAGTTAADGDGIDVWCGSLDRPGLDAIVCTIDAEQRDAEIKLLLGCTSEEKETILAFLNKGSMAALLVER